MGTWKQGRHKMAISQKPSVGLVPNFHSTFLRVSTMLWSTGNGVKVMMTSQQGTSNDMTSQEWKIQSFSCSYYHLKLTNDKERYSLLFPVSMWFLCSLLECPFHSLNLQFIPPFVNRNTLLVRLISLPITATMIYYERCSCMA